jgi:hypothetical protein
MWCVDVEVSCVDLHCFPMLTECDAESNASMALATGYFVHGRLNLTRTRYKHQSRQRW